MADNTCYDAFLYLITPVCRNGFKRSLPPLKMSLTDCRRKDPVRQLLSGLDKSF